MDIANEALSEFITQIRVTLHTDAAGMFYLPGSCAEASARR
jgi:hypothetical protein